MAVRTAPSRLAGTASRSWQGHSSTSATVQLLDGGGGNACTYASVDLPAACSAAELGRPNTFGLPRAANLTAVLELLPVAEVWLVWLPASGTSVRPIGPCTKVTAGIIIIRRLSA
jgi:hypothetical protein